MRERERTHARDTDGGRRDGPDDGAGVMGEGVGEVLRLHGHLTLCTGRLH